MESSNSVPVVNKVNNLGYSQKPHIISDSQLTAALHTLNLK